jgi:hypothetical protein
VRLEAAAAELGSASAKGVHALAEGWQALHASEDFNAEASHFVEAPDLENLRGKVVPTAVFSASDIVPLHSPRSPGEGEMTTVICHGEKNQATARTLQALEASLARVEALKINGQLPRTDEAFAAAAEFKAATEAAASVAKVPMTPTSAPVTPSRPFSPIRRWAARSASAARKTIADTHPVLKLAGTRPVDYYTVYGEATGRRA